MERLWSSSAQCRPARCPGHIPVASPRPPYPPLHRLWGRVLYSAPGRFAGGRRTSPSVNASPPALSHPARYCAASITIPPLAPWMRRPWVCVQFYHHPPTFPPRFSFPFFPRTPLPSTPSTPPLTPPHRPPPSAELPSTNQRCSTRPNADTGLWLAEPEVGGARPPARLGLSFRLPSDPGPVFLPRVRAPALSPRPAHPPPPPSSAAALALRRAGQLGRLRSAPPPPNVPRHLPPPSHASSDTPPVYGRSTRVGPSPPESALIGALSDAASAHPPCEGSDSAPRHPTPCTLFTSPSS